MKLLDKAKRQFTELITKRGLTPAGIERAATGLSPEEVIGNPKRQDYPLLTGEEVMIEAEFRGYRGQAFTDHPGEFSGSLQEVINLSIAESSYHRALLVASINAVLRSLELVERTVHCRDQEMEMCVEKIVNWVDSEYPGAKKIGIIGFQPALLESFSKSHGPENVLNTDLHPDRIGKIKYGIKVWDGATRGEELIREAEFILGTGSTITNGTIDGLVNHFNKYEKPYRFYGNTISGVAYLLGLPQLCFHGR